MTMTSTYRLLSLPLCLAACFSSNNSNPSTDMAMGDPHAGGTIVVSQCGYSVTTRDGAAIPQPGSPMLGSDPTPWAIHLGLRGDPATSMVVVWRTNDDATLATTVQYGTGGQTGQSQDGFTYVYDLPVGSSPRIHEVDLCGLTPDTTYTYRVGGKGAGGAEKWSPNYTFRTGPDPATVASSNITVAVMGDTRDGYDVWGQLLQLVETTGMPDVILFSGDAVLLGQDQPEWDTWFKNSEAILHSVPLLSAHGNHDNNAVNYFSQLPLPGAEDHYGIDYGAMHLTVVNDTPAPLTDVTGVQQQFLDSDLAANQSKPWKFVMHHQPMWSACAGHGSNLQLQMQWGPIVDKYAVDLVINGHDHDYERTKPLKAGMVQSSSTQGTTYLVVGSAGAPLYDNGSDFWTAFSSKTYSFVIMHVRQGMIDLKAYAPGGAVIDTLTLTK
jgi:hypothetical protein